MTQGLLAGSGFELLRISDSGVSVTGLPLKMTPVWLLGERFDELLSVGRDDFQVQECDVQLFQLFLKVLVSRADELVGCSKHGARAFGEAIEVCNHVLYMVRVHL